MKKENIYINLQGKSKDELTELYWVLKNNNQKLARHKLNDFLGYKNHSSYHVLICDALGWSGDNRFDKIEVTIEQLKEILQPMENKEEQLRKEAKERGFLTEGNEFYSCFDDRNELRIIKPYDSESEINLYLDEGGYLRYDDGLNNDYNERLCSNPAIYKEGVWAEIIKPMENKEFDLSMCRVQVDKEEQAKQLQEYAFSQGFYWRSGKIKGSKLKNLDYPYYYFCSTDNSITYCDNDFNNGKYKEIHFNDIFKTETLEQRLEKAEAEVKRLKEAIEEENKPKIGDWVYNKEEDIIYQKSYNVFNQYENKITNPELIKLLEKELIKQATEL